MEWHFHPEPKRGRERWDEEGLRVDDSCNWHYHKGRRREGAGGEEGEVLCVHQLKPLKSTSVRSPEK